MKSEPMNKDEMSNYKDVIKGILILLIPLIIIYLLLKYA